MESIEILNSRLIDYYGIDSSTGQPMFRIVWANNETEKRLIEESDNGVRFLYPVVREVKKYPYLKDLYVLERLVVIPPVNQDELPASKLSYEPIWAYRGVNGESQIPIWEATEFVVDALYAALGKKSLAKYVDSEKNTTPEGREERITELQEELFGNETDVGDALAYNGAIVVPSDYKKE
jgi:hypothetical protein